MAANPSVDQAAQRVVEISRNWISSGRSIESDNMFLKNYNQAFKAALSQWDLWTRHFRTLVQDLSGLSLDQIAFTNLAKCRIPYPSRVSPYKMIRLCQEQFPVDDLLERIQPRVILLSVLPAAREGDLVESWSASNCRPKLIAWQGRTGHDRHNTAAGRREFKRWAPEAAEIIQGEVREFLS